MALFQVWTDEMNPGYDKILPDVGFMTLPILENEWISDVYIHALLIAAFIRVSFTKYTETAFRRFFWISGFLYIFRSFTISFTILPTPYAGCTLQKHENPLLVALKVISGQHSTCGDVMYSGHTMVLTSSALLWQLFTDDPVIVKILVWILSFIGMLIIVATRFHYSDDVIIAFLLTLTLYVIYHWALWIGEVNKFGGNTPFSIIGILILKIDGSYDESDWCIGNKHVTKGVNYSIPSVEQAVQNYNPRLYDKGCVNYDDVKLKFVEEV